MSTVVHYGRKEYRFDTNEVTGAELRRAFNAPLGDDLYFARGSKIEGAAIQDAALVAIKNGDHFISAPKDVSGGRAVDLHPDIELEAREAISEFAAFGEGDIEIEGSERYLRFYAPAPGWTVDPVEVLVRIPPLYPQERPDLLLLPGEARGPSGDVPRKMQDVEVLGKPRAQISWHFTGGYDPTAPNLIRFARSAMLFLRNPQR